jgi:hypothetical protein
MEIEAEAEQTPLARSYEIVLALHSAVEEGGTLEYRSERGGSLLEVLV